MFISELHDSGAAGKAMSAMRSGQIVKISPNADRALNATLVSAVGDATAKLGLAYADQMRKAWNQGTTITVNNVSDTTRVFETIDNGEVIAVLTGFIKGMLSEMEDGLYSPGEPLTINWATATLKMASGGDPVHGRVAYTQQPIRVVNRNEFVQVTLTLPLFG